MIAEVKKASPSKGVLRERFVPAEIAASYARHGAACLSRADRRALLPGLRPPTCEQARAACALPVLRKDFIVDAYQVVRGARDGRRLHPADRRLPGRCAAGGPRGHARRRSAWRCWSRCTTRAELDRALRLQTPLVGINNRNLRTFEVSLDTTLGLLADVPADRLLVTESGILARADVQRMRDAGVHAFLVGEAFMRAADPGAALAELFGREPPDRGRSLPTFEAVHPSWRALVQAWRDERRRAGA